MFLETTCIDIRYFLESATLIVCKQTNVLKLFLKNQINFIAACLNISAFMQKISLELNIVSCQIYIESVSKCYSKILTQKSTVG